jgi:hypothetical protein
MRKSTFTKNGKIYGSFLCFLVSFIALAQDSTETKWKISGGVDTYFRTNLNGLNKEVPIIEGGEQTGSIDAAAPASSFANSPGFALGMFNLIGAYEGEKVGAVADLVFGPRGEDAVFGSPEGSTNIINQLYVYWKPSENIKLTLGNFNTFLGYEVINPAANFHYSTSYLFSYGPFSHSGLKADFELGKGWSAMVAFLSATDFTDSNPFGEFSLGAQIGYAGQFINLLYGKQSFGTALIDGVKTDIDNEPLFQIDYTGGFDLSESIYLGINASYQDTDGSGFYGAALYPAYKFSDNAAIGLRAEYFKELEDGGPVYGADIESIAFTLTGDLHFKGLNIKPELRLDSVSEDVFINPDLEAKGQLASFLVAAIYTFN